LSYQLVTVGRTVPAVAATPRAIETLPIVAIPLPAVERRVTADIDLDEVVFDGDAAGGALVVRSDEVEEALPASAIAEYTVCVARSNERQKAFAWSSASPWHGGSPASTTAPPSVVVPPSSLTGGSTFSSPNVEHAASAASARPRR